MENQQPESASLEPLTQSPEEILAAQVASLKDVMGDASNYLKISPLEFTPSKWTYANAHQALLCWDKTNQISLVDPQTKQVVFRVPVNQVTQYAYNNYNGQLRLTNGALYFLTFNPETRSLEQERLVSDMTWQAIPSKGPFSNGLRIGMWLGLSSEQKEAKRKLQTANDNTDLGWWVSQLAQNGVKIGQTGAQKFKNVTIGSAIVIVLCLIIFAFSH